MTLKGDAYNPDEEVELMREERRYGQEPDDQPTKMPREEISMLACEIAEDVLHSCDGEFVHAYAENTDDPSGFTPRGRELFELVYNAVMHRMGGDE